MGTVKRRAIAVGAVGGGEREHRAGDRVGRTGDELERALARRGDGEAAYALIAQSPFGDDAPWRLFLYGDFPRLPRLIAELRRGVTR